jgi:hypothetical protein
LFKLCLLSVHGFFKLFLFVLSLALRTKPASRSKRT